ncbi:hypothetical protein AAGG74_14965 [Bacillus mexicanus]|uniref:hypothetical protein n=1 Tax=Bacillus mexicanus TaxID=2834415 RepID=UPI003D219808
MRGMKEMSIINLNEQNEIYLTNTLGEEIGHKEIADNIYEWYENNCVDNEWLQYLVEINGEVGILALQEFPHPDGDNWNDDKHYYSDEWKNSSAQKIWKHLENVVNEINKLVDFNVMLGKETGFMARHEVCIWFPFATEKKSLEETFQKIKDIKLLF